MIASLYQSGSSSVAAAAGSAASIGMIRFGVSLAMSEAEDVGLAHAGIEPDVVPVPPPGVVGVGDQIVCIVGPRRVGSEGRHPAGGHLHEAVLHVMRVEVHDDEEPFAVRRALAVG